MLVAVGGKDFQAGTVIESKTSMSLEVSHDVVRYSSFLNSYWYLFETPSAKEHLFSSMSSSPHRCDTCDANCNFTVPSNALDDEGVPLDSRVYVRNLRLAVNDLYDTLIVKGNYGTQDINEIITEMELLLDRFRDVYNFFKTRK